jgi:hypothetical protein
MCITLIKKASGAPISKDILYRCFDRNPHGAGLAFASNNKITLVKGFFRPEDLWDYYKKMPQDVVTLMHFRFASTGTIDPKNCHPWRIDKEHVMVHNGTVWDFWSEKSEISDTGRFVHMLLQPLFKKDKFFWRRKVGQYLLNKVLWPGKMIILRNNGDYVIFNEQAGEWHEGSWFSNDGYKDESVYCNTLFPRQLCLPLEFPQDEDEEVDTTPLSLLV